MLTRQQKILLRQSFGSIAQAHHEVSRSFYDRLFELDPTVKGLFRHNLEDQRMKLMGMLAIVVTSLDNLDFLITAARDMGRRHARYGVKPGDYATVRAALLYALGRSCPHVMTPPIEAAWAALYDLVAYNALRP
jgi:hemoglobin-like flavoprotein